MSDEGVQKAATFLLALGEDGAAEVMKFLGPREVQKIGAAMATIGAIPHERIAKVMEDFKAAADVNSSVGLDSDEYIRNVLTKALGDDKASSLLNRILGGKDASGIESLKWMDSTSVADLIKNEHPQIVATILVHLESDQACEILNNFTERLRNDVVLRIATLDGIQPTALRELNDVLTKLLTGNESLKKKSIGGVRAAAEILNFMIGANTMVIWQKKSWMKCLSSITFLKLMTKVFNYCFEKCNLIPSLSRLKVLIKICARKSSKICLNGQLR